jgi:hypothetical protein
MVGFSDFPLGTSHSTPPLSIPSSGIIPKDMGDKRELKELFQGTVNPPASVTNKTLVKFSTSTQETETNQIEDSLQQLKQVNENIQLLQNQALTSNSSQTMVKFVQTWVADFILKGGTAIARTGIPFIVHSSEALGTLNPTLASITVVTDLMDSSAGAIGLIYQYRALQTAREGVAEIKANVAQLDSHQKSRLAHLEKLIAYEESLLPTKGIEQTLRVVRNFFSFSRFISSNPIISSATSLTAGANVLMGGLDAALAGLFFFQAHQQLKKGRSWSKEFKAWIKNTTLSISKLPGENPEAVKQTSQLVAQFQEKRMLREKKQIQHLKEKMGKQEISMESIRERIEKFKVQGLEKFISQLDIKKLSLDAWKNQLEEKVGTPLKPELVNSLRNASLRLSKMNKDEKGLVQENPKGEKIKEHLQQELKSCVQTWMSQQSEDSLLLQYMDYNSVIDTTVKGAITEMVKKKHQIEKGLLKFQRNVLGTRFAVASIIFAVALALAIVALAANPVGAAGLILMILTVSSVVIGLGLTGASYYYAHQQKPRVTAATLKGSFFRLFYYQSVAQFLSVKEKIGDYLDSAWQNRKKQLVAMLGKQTLSPQGTSGKDEDVKEMIAKDNIDADYQKAQSQAQVWKQKALQLQKEFEEMTWADFAEKADLKIAKESDKADGNSPKAFDTLEAFNEALNAGDLDLLSNETKELLEKQLGLNIHSLQMEIAKDPSIIKKQLQNFFTLDNVNFMRFVGQQA